MTLKLLANKMRDKRSAKVFLTPETCLEVRYILLHAHIQKISRNRDMQTLFLLVPLLIMYCTLSLSVKQITCKLLQEFWCLRTANQIGTISRILILSEISSDM